MIYQIGDNQVDARASSLILLVNSQESGMLAECVDAKWKESQGADLISVISTKSPDMTKDSNAGQLGDDMFGFGE